MAKFELAQVTDKEGTPITIGSQLTGEVLEFDPDSNTKYIFTFDMGNLPPDIIRQQLDKWAEMLRVLLGPGRCLVSAKTASDKTPIQIYELRAVETDSEPSYS